MQKSFLFLLAFIANAFAQNSIQFDEGSSLSVSNLEDNLATSSRMLTEESQSQNVQGRILDLELPELEDLVNSVTKQQQTKSASKPVVAEVKFDENDKERMDEFLNDAKSIISRGDSKGKTIQNLQDLLQSTAEKIKQANAKGTLRYLHYLTLKNTFSAIAMNLLELPDLTFQVIDEITRKAYAKGRTETIESTTQKIDSAALNLFGDKLAKYQVSGFLLRCQTLLIWMVRNYGTVNVVSRVKSLTLAEAGEGIKQLVKHTRNLHKNKQFILEDQENLSNKNLVFIYVKKALQVVAHELFKVEFSISESSINKIFSETMPTIVKKQYPKAFEVIDPSNPPKEANSKTRMNNGGVMDRMAKNNRDIMKLLAQVTSDKEKRDIMRQIGKRSMSSELSNILTGLQSTKLFSKQADDLANSGVPGAVPPSPLPKISRRPKRYGTKVKRVRASQSDQFNKLNKVNQFDQDGAEGDGEMEDDLPPLPPKTSMRRKRRAAGKFPPLSPSASIPPTLRAPAGDISSVPISLNDNSNQFPSNPEPLRKRKKSKRRRSRGKRSRRNSTINDV